MPINQTNIVLCARESRWVITNYLVINHALPIPGPATLGEIVDSSKFDEGGEDKSVAHSDEPVHGRSIGYFGQRVTGTDTQSGHSQHCGHT